MGDFDSYWEIDEWGSHPDEENDDCWVTTDPFKADEHDARRFFKSFQPTEGSGTMYLVLVRLGAKESNVVEPVAYRRNPGYRKPRPDNSWRDEQAMQAGMAFGCDGYNDAMGY